MGNPEDCSALAENNIKEQMSSDYTLGMVHNPGSGMLMKLQAWDAAIAAALKKTRADASCEGLEVTSVCVSPHGEEPHCEATAVTALPSSMWGDILQRMKNSQHR